MDYISQEMNRIESTGRIIEEQVSILIITTHCRLLKFIMNYIYNLFQLAQGIGSCGRRERDS